MPDSSTTDRGAPASPLLCQVYEICVATRWGDHGHCPGSGDGECHGPRDCTGTEVGCRHCEAGMYPDADELHRVLSEFSEPRGEPSDPCDYEAGVEPGEPGIVEEKGWMRALAEEPGEPNE